MSTTYSTNIEIDGTGTETGTAAQYEMRLQGILDDIHATLTGAALISYIGLRHHPIRIVPLAADPAGPQPTYGVYARPDDDEDAFVRGARLRQFDGSNFGRVFGTGTGTGSHIMISPHLAASIGQGHIERVLVHEMVHATRHVAGLMRNTAMKGFDSRDEFYGICVENMLASEKGWMLRMRHGDDAAAYVKTLGWALTREPFHAALFRLYADMKVFFTSMAGVKSTSNPFKDWLGATGGRL